MSDEERPGLPEGYKPAKVWEWKKGAESRFSNINRPTAGAQEEKELPVGKHPFQLYSLGTPNGVKVTLMFEELLAAGHEGAEYDAWLTNIGDGSQFASGFVEINPNSKIPALMDRSGDESIRIFESGAMLIHLAEKFGEFLPTETAARAECLSWVMWQMASAPFLGGGFGHFYAYAPVAIEYAIDRYAMEVKRQLDVLDQHLANNKYMCGDDYTIADMAIWPWYGWLAQGKLYESAEFIQCDSYKHVNRWADEVGAREAVQRGQIVNRSFGKKALLERHEASDIDAVLEAAAE